MRLRATGLIWRQVRSSQTALRHARHGAGRLIIDVCGGESSRGSLAHDVRSGLGRSEKRLPPKYFYDDLGSKLFDRICRTPEYYPTRSEHALLAQIADRLVAPPSGPSDLLELGSGAARKTRILLDAISRCSGRCRYLPFDVSESMLEESALELLDEYPWLMVHGLVGDYEQGLAALPPGERRLVLFLGSTIGNFEPARAVEFLTSIASVLRAGERLLLGTDLVKSRAELDAAYNDAQGLTAAFNKNVLRVINRELGGHFALDRFEHVAFFNEEASQIEMYLESKLAQRVVIERLELEVKLEAGERILTEISRKFTRDSAACMLAEAGLELTSWLVSPDSRFALSVSVPR